MKKCILYILLFFIIISDSYAQKNQISTIRFGIHTGIYMPLVYKTYSSPKLKLGLPSFSYTASVENKLSLNNQLNFTLQYSLTFFSLLQQKLNSIQTQIKQAPEVKTISSFQSNVGYYIKKDVTLIAGIGLNLPMRFEQFSNQSELKLYSETNTNQENKYTSHLSPYFICGIEKDCKLFKNQLSYSIQYQLGFVPNRNIQANNNFTPFQAITIGLKYKY